MYISICIRIHVFHTSTGHAFRKRALYLLQKRPATLQKSPIHSAKESYIFCKRALRLCQRGMCVPIPHVYRPRTHVRSAVMKSKPTTPNTKPTNWPKHLLLQAGTHMPLLQSRRALLQKIYDSFAECIGLFCRVVGLCCRRYRALLRNVWGSFAEGIGLLCRVGELFCRRYRAPLRNVWGSLADDIGLFCGILEVSCPSLP